MPLSDSVIYLLKITLEDVISCCLFLYWINFCFSIAFVQFNSADDVKAAIEGQQGTSIDGRQVTLDYVGSKSQNQGGRGTKKILTLKTLLLILEQAWMHFQVGFPIGVEVKTEVAGVEVSSINSLP